MNAMLCGWQYPRLASNSSIEHLPEAIAKVFFHPGSPTRVTVTMQVQQLTSYQITSDSEAYSQYPATRCNLAGRVQSLSF